MNGGEVNKGNKKSFSLSSCPAQSAHANTILHKWIFSATEMPFSYMSSFLVIFTHKVFIPK